MYLYIMSTGEIGQRWDKPTDKHLALVKSGKLDIIRLDWRTSRTFHYTDGKNWNVVDRIDQNLKDLPVVDTKSLDKMGDFMPDGPVEETSGFTDQKLSVDDLE